MPRDGLFTDFKQFKKKARDLITPYNQNFKASYKWAKRFLLRIGFSARTTTTKMKKNEEEVEEIKQKTPFQAHRLILENKINPKFIINVDETPMYLAILTKESYP